MPSALQKLLQTYREGSQTQREKGQYFERLVKTYLLNEPSYRDLFGEQVYLWEEWRVERQRQGHPDPGGDAGIDLVAVEEIEENPRTFAIQAKFYDQGTRLGKRDLDSFLSAMGTQPYTNGMLFLTTTEATDNLTKQLQGRDKPVNTITLFDLETSHIDWSQYQPDVTPAFRERKTPRPHQKTAIEKVLHGLSEVDRGKLIMACGTGKTLTSLKIAEEVAGAGGQVLFLVPSLALLSQTLTEWSQESAIPLHNFAVCSDSDVGKKKPSDDVQMMAHELRYPATTNAEALAREVQVRHDQEHMSVIYGTYHSIEVVSRAQKEHGLPDFDLIVCDEAHRTTGSTWLGEGESHFVKVHDGEILRSAKRLYMTATPRIYGPAAKAKQEEGSVDLFSMDDETHYGAELHTITFSEAVERDLLCDYKVIVLAVDAAHVTGRLQGLLADDNNTLKVDDAARIVGCWKALAKLELDESSEDDPMRRAVAFCQVIEAQYRGKKHKVSSKQIAQMFQAVVESYQQSEVEEGREHGTLICEAAHIDGTMNASQKEEKINWLKVEAPEDTCRILSNVRCLSEGVDVPALDAVLFLSPRNSQVDVVQSVGRVMRRAPGKQRGYVVLPVVIPEGVEPHKALDDNETYRVVWEVLQALRSHDDRFDALVNKLDLIGKDTSKMEVVAVTDDVSPKPTKPMRKRTHTISQASELVKPIEDQLRIHFETGELERALYAKIVQKCGNRMHWEDWAGDIAKIAQTHITRLRAILDDQRNKREIKAFNAFAAELRDDLNDSVTDDDVIEMLAQHQITQPVFDALFEDYSFAANNPVSQAIQKVLDVLEEHHLEKEADTLQRFYDSVRLRVEGITEAEAKQRIVVELYEKFFQKAFPRMTERLGIVYTPVEIVDFIIHSVNHILEQEFGKSLGSAGVHILDAFAGTGTFITRLLQSGLIGVDELPHKYAHEIHANEMVLLAYYIAAINIEETYHHVLNQGAETSEHEYQPFNGICLTDTFQMYESDDLVSELMEDNSGRRMRQKEVDIQIIIGNPPYSVGQRSANDNNANLSYAGLDARIEETYVRGSAATNVNALYDSYIRAMRWASDRLGTTGVVGFVTNAGFLEMGSADGLRRCLVEEFSSIYVFHLRGNQRSLGEVSNKEGGKIFGSGSRAPIAVSILVKNPNAKEHGQIYFHDIGDYLSREQKLNQVSEFGSVAGITAANGWKGLVPDRYGDWLNQRDDTFHQHAALGNKEREKGQFYLFENYSIGVKTQRDAWCYNFSYRSLSGNMSRMIEFYNEELRRFDRKYSGLDTQSRQPLVNSFVDNDAKQISWTRALKQELAKGRALRYVRTSFTLSMYRPFTKQQMYFHRRLNEMVYQMPKVFPEVNTSYNLVIQVNANWNKFGHIAFISGCLPDLHCNGDSQCFPLYLYDQIEGTQVEAHEANDLFALSAVAEQQPTPPPPINQSHTSAETGSRMKAYGTSKVRILARRYPRRTSSTTSMVYCTPASIASDTLTI